MMRCRLVTMMLLFLTVTSIFTSYLTVPKAEAQNTVVKVTAPATVGASNVPLPTDPFTVTVTIEDVSDLYAWQVKLYYNSTMLDTRPDWVWYPADHVFAGKSYTQTGPMIDKTAGYVFVGATLLGDVPRFSGDGTLFKMNFTGIKPGTSALTFSTTDSWGLDYDLEYITFAPSDGSVQILGIPIGDQPSTITINVYPKTVYQTQTAIINGSITPIKQEVDVTIERMGPGDIAWQDLATVKTNTESVYSYDWNVPEDLTPGLHQLKAGWIGDQTNAGNTSDIINATVLATTTILTVNFADGRNIPAVTGTNAIGEAEEPLPTPPVTFNVTVHKVESLAEWQVKLYYDSTILRMQNVSIPADNVFGADRTVTQPVTGTDGGGSFVRLSALFTGVGSGFTGDNGTLCQVNFTGILPGVSILELAKQDQATILINSTAAVIPYKTEYVLLGVKRDDLPVQVLGKVTTRFTVVNPATAKSEFVFSTEETAVGSKFNVTVEASQASKMYAWRVKLSYNATLLNATQAWIPTWDDRYVFKGRNSDSVIAYESGSVLVNDTLPIKENLFNGSGLLLIIEFEIALAPPEGSQFSTSLKITNDYTRWTSDGTVWEVPATTDGVYRYVGGELPVDSDGEPAPFDFMVYVPYAIGGIAAVIGVAVFLRFWKKRQSPVT